MESLLSLFYISEMLFVHNQGSSLVSEFLIRGREYAQEEWKLSYSHFVNFQKDAEGRIRVVWWGVTEE